MIKLDENNIIEYLKGRKVFKEVDLSKAIAREVQENTNVNFVFEVSINSARKIYIKQAFGFVKIKPDFPAPIDRQYYEKLSIDYLQKYWGGRIPEVVDYDKDNNILAMTDVGIGAKLLAEEIEKGQLHFEVGKDLGLMMAQLHAPTYKKKDFPVRSEDTNGKHVEFIFDFRLRGARETLPEETNRLFEESQKVESAMIYGDWASKNVFVADGKVRLVDFENLARFDPAFDIGYALAHWALEISEDNREAQIVFFENFEHSYNDLMKMDFEKIMERATRYLGGMMLHRLAGVKNTNRLDKYLSREIPLIEVSKRIMTSGYSLPSLAVGGVDLN